MPSIEINGTTLEYIQKGSGDPVIFVHGSVSDFRTWHAQVEPFSQRYTVFAYSRRYHFPNNAAGNGSDYTVDTHAQDLASFIRKLGLSRVHLIGSSYGAYTALLTGIRNAEYVRTLVLGEPPVLPLLAENPDNPLHMVSLLTTSPLTAIRFMKFGLKAIKPAREAFRQGNLEEGVKLFANGVLGEGGFDRLPPTARGVFMDNAKALMTELLGPGFSLFPVEEAKNCRIPVLFLYGEKSPKFFHDISHRLSKILQKTEASVISNASHSMHRDNPGEYNEKVLDFLSRHS
ncbi:MAG: alpha/beta hydrolase [Ignavibacteriales bacterium]|nr:alpha/beta hydrolase [Ignavibacteriales bacterium]